MLGHCITIVVSKCCAQFDSDEPKTQETGLAATTPRATTWTPGTDCLFTSTRLSALPILYSAAADAVCYIISAWHRGKTDTKSGYALFQDGMGFFIIS